jgi:hypothetical protein
VFIFFKKKIAAIIVYFIEIINNNPDLIYMTMFDKLRDRTGK